MKLVILSGTFNPIHNSHLSLVKFVRENFKYDKILLVPAYNPPFKKNVTPAFQRMEMVKLAAYPYDWLEVSDVEYKLKGISYSILTIQELYRIYDIEGKIGFITGTDAFRDVNKWYKSELLKNAVDFIVFERGFSYNETEVVTRIKEGFKIIKAQLPFEDISSEIIRKKAAAGEDIGHLVPKEVERYIKENGLYK